MILLPIIVTYLVLYAIHATQHYMLHVIQPGLQNIVFNKC